jgi:hypothetical protein
LDIVVFQLLKSQAIEAFGLLLATREFASAKGLHTDAECLNDYLAENQQISSIVDEQISELKQINGIFRLGLFDTIN